MAKIIMCSARVYEYNGWTFEFGYCGPWPLLADGELRKRCGRKFFSDIADFLRMSDEDQCKYRVGGGCEFIDKH